MGAVNHPSVLTGQAPRPFPARRAGLALGWLVLAFLSCLGAGCAPARAALPSGTEPPRVEAPIHLVLLHTNDVHGQVLPRLATWVSKEAPPEIGGLPRLAAKVALLRKAEPEALLVDAGDWYQGTPEGSLDQGLGFVRALALLRYDAACVGNHEFDHGVANVERLARDSGLPALLANVRDPSGARPSWARPWIVLRRAGVRIALVGLLTTGTPEITSPELRAYRFTEPADELARVRSEIGSQADLIVPVGHIAVEEARELARREPGLALIVSGHSHTYLAQGERVGDTLIVQSGSKASALGRVDLWLDPKTFTPLRSEARLIDLTEDPRASGEPPSADLAAVFAAGDALVARASAELDVVVGELASPFLRAVSGGVSAPGSWIADLLRARMGAEVGIHNRGGTRCDLAAGPVTRRELFELLPFDNDVVAMDVVGRDLFSLVKRSIETTRHTGLDFSGLTLFVSRGPDGSPRLERLEVGGAPLEPERAYRVATNSFLAGGGDGAVELERGTARQSDPAWLRDAAEGEFRRLKRVVPPDDAARRHVEVKP